MSDNNELTIEKLDELIRSVESTRPSIEILRITTHPDDLDYIKERIREQLKPFLSATKKTPVGVPILDTLFDIPIIPMECVPPDTLIIWHPGDKFTIVKNLRTGGEVGETNPHLPVDWLEEQKKGWSPEEFKKRYIGEFPDDYGK